jgi:hypothetical protein
MSMHVKNSSIRSSSTARRRPIRSAAPAAAARPEARRAGSIAAAAPTEFIYTQLEVQTGPGIAVYNIMPQLREEIARAKIQNGTVNVLSR